MSSWDVPIATAVANVPAVQQVQTKLSCLRQASLLATTSLINQFLAACAQVQPYKQYMIPLL